MIKKMDSNYVMVEGSKMHYLEQGTGDPILFLHGVPTSSYIWRNIIPHLTTLGRCIAPDLIGMGQSDKPDIAYTIHDHIKYIEQFIKALQLQNITLVMHGWGSIIGFDYAMRQEENCKGLAFYEAYLHPLQVEELSLPYQEQIVSLYDKKSAQDLILNSAYFVDTVLPQSMLSSLNEEEMSHYRKPFLNIGTGKVLLQYLQEVPKGDNNSQVDKIIQHYSKKLMKSSLPKLMLYSIPGFITTMNTVMWAKEHLSHLEIVEVGEDLHYAQESNPNLIGDTISVWLQGMEQSHEKFL